MAAQRSTFQLILLGVFGFFIIVGVLIFAFGRFGGGGGDEVAAEAEVWGTLPTAFVNEVVNQVNLEGSAEVSVVYQEFREETFDAELVEALAGGRGPDAVLLSHDRIVRHSDKVFAWPLESFSERQLKDTFIEEGELFLTESGVIGLPFSVDPLVLYWNRSLLSANGFARPPQFWDELAGFAERVTERDAAANIVRSALALGEYRNIQNAQEVLTALLLQAGDEVVERTVNGLSVVLGAREGQAVAPADSALTFYTEFANPIKDIYSWNRALPEARQAFLAGDVALYIGHASELFEIRERNPNLNFDVASLPQIRDRGEQKTFGTLHAFAVLRASDNPVGAFQAAGIMTGPFANDVWARVSGLPPTRRDLLLQEPTDAFRAVFYDAALIADGFLEPDPAGVERVFQDMIEDVTSGRARVGQSIIRAADGLRALLGQ